MISHALTLLEVLKKKYLIAFHAVTEPIWTTDSCNAGNLTSFGMNREPNYQIVLTAFLSCSINKLTRRSRCFQLHRISPRKFRPTSVTRISESLGCPGSSRREIWNQKMRQRWWTCSARCCSKQCSALLGNGQTTRESWLKSTTTNFMKLKASSSCQSSNWLCAGLNSFKIN